MATKKKTAKARKPAPRRAPAVDPIELELKQLQLEEIRMSLATKRATSEMRKLQAASQEEQFAKSREDDRRRWRNCNHRKGGKDKAGIGNGSDSDYAVIKHTYPNMEPSVLCQRCQMDWRKGTTKTRMPNGDPNPTGISFEEAMAWPTDNEPSCATFFMIPANDAALVAQVSALTAQLRNLRAQGINVEI